MEYMIRIFPQLLKGMSLTFMLFSFTLLGAIPLGGLVAVGLQNKVMKPVLNVYIWFMRGTPLLLQIIFVYYGLPLLGIVFDRMPSASIAFILNYGAYFAEIFRGGFESVEKGQFEAAALLHFTKKQTLRYIIFPQVVKRVLPALGNEVINLIKDTSLIYILGLSDVMRLGKIAMERDTTLLPLVGVALLYLTLTFILTLVLNYLEKKQRYYQ